MARGIFLLLCGLLISPGDQAYADDDDDTPLFELTAAEALERMEDGDLTSEEYVTALLEHADLLEELNVFISHDPAVSSRLQGRPTSAGPGGATTMTTTAAG